MRHTVTTLGGLRCRVLDSSETAPPELLVLLCHGYGAPGDDLVPLAPELLSRAPSLEGRVRFIFPEAPLELAEQGNPGGRAWWHLDLERLMMRQQGLPVPEETEVPKDAVKSRRQLMAAVDEATRQAKLPVSRVVLGGFSQGAMLATGVALNLEEAPAALGIFSGTLPPGNDWATRAPGRRGLRVFQTHGRTDPLLSFERAEALRDLLTQSGLEVEFLPFSGGHTIVEAALTRFAALLAASLPKGA